MASTLLGAERIIDGLTPADQARLLRYLASKVAGAAWERLLDVGRRLAAKVPPGVSVADVVSDVRR